MDCQEMINELRAQASEKYRENMIRMGIPAENSIGVATSVVRGLAKKAGKSQELASELWNTKYHEARMLAVLLMNPRQRGCSLMWFPGIYATTCVKIYF